MPPVSGSPPVLSQPGDARPLAPTALLLPSSVAQDTPVAVFHLLAVSLRAGQSLIIPAPLCPAQGLGQSGCQGGLGMESSPVSALKEPVTVKGEV